MVFVALQEATVMLAVITGLQNRGIHHGLCGITGSNYDVSSDNWSPEQRDTPWSL